MDLGGCLSTVILAESAGLSVRAIWTVSPTLPGDLSRLRFAGFLHHCRHEGTNKVLEHQLGTATCGCQAWLIFNLFLLTILRILFLGLCLSLRIVNKIFLMRLASVPKGDHHVAVFSNASPYFLHGHWHLKAHEQHTEKSLLKTSKLHVQEGPTARLQRAKRIVLVDIERLLEILKERAGAVVHEPLLIPQWQRHRFEVCFSPRQHASRVNSQGFHLHAEHFKACQLLSAEHLLELLEGLEACASPPQAQAVHVSKILQF
mmetsp:Transcript_95315/g.169220  ORF Transcript_95315/g.169220 Transcript_95315/m.169220 type:complete len:260 (+) Transcript_95315:3226-4005(+)